MKKNEKLSSRLVINVHNNNAKINTARDDIKFTPGPLVGSGGMGSSALHLSPLQKQISMSVMVTFLSCSVGRLDWSIFTQASVCSEQMTPCSPMWLRSLSQPWRPTITVLFSPVVSSSVVK